VGFMGGDVWSGGVEWYQSRREPLGERARPSCVGGLGRFTGVWCVCVHVFPFSRAPVPHSLSQTSPPFCLSSGLVSREEGA
jgi:hypothetical protein